MPDDVHHRVDWVAPRILALAVMSSAFTGQAIALGFDRRYGVLKRLAATALPRWLLVAGKLVAALVVVTVQAAVLGGIAIALGWSPTASGIGAAVLLLVVGTVSFGALGVLLGGALRAEAVLALANIVWFMLLLAGGIVVGPDTLPGALGTVVSYLRRPPSPTDCTTHWPTARSRGHRWRCSSRGPRPPPSWPRARPS